MNEIIFYLSLLLVALPYFFWGRGIIRGNINDLVMGVTILLIILGGLVALGGFQIGGILLFIFGGITLALDYFAKPNCPINRTSRISIAIIICIVLGVLFSPAL